MDCHITHRDSHCQVGMSGQFTFADNVRFRDILDSIDQHSSKSVTLNLKKVDFIDSAALGMLLLLGEKGKTEHFSITLEGAEGQVRRMFDLSRFDSLFTLVY